MRTPNNHNEKCCERDMTVDHIAPCAYDRMDCIENLWLLCGARDFSKGTRSQE